MFKFLKGIIGIVIVGLVVVLVWNWWSDRNGESKPIEDMVGNFTGAGDLSQLFGNADTEEEKQGVSLSQLTELLGEVDVKEVLGALSSGDTASLEKLKEQLGDVSLDKLADMGVYDINEQSVFDSTREIYTAELAKTALGTDITSMQVNVGGCVLKLADSEDGGFHIQAKDYGKLQYYVENGTLYLHSTKSNGNIESVADGEILLYIPVGTVFQNVKLELGAGSVTGVILEAQAMKLQVGLGNFEVTTMKADTLELEVSMGQMKTIADVGTSVKAGNSMGNMDLTLQGKAEDYNYKIAGAMGKITLDDAAYEGAVSNDEINNNAAKSVDLECSMGNIKVDFTERQ